MAAPFSQDELQQKLKGYCNWSSLPPELLLLSTHSKPSSSSSHGAAGPQQQQLAAFLQQLTTLVPSEWSVVQQSVFEAPNSSKADGGNTRRLHAMMHAPGVGTADSLMCFGGVQLGILQVGAWVKLLFNFNCMCLAWSAVGRSAELFLVVVGLSIRRRSRWRTRCRGSRTASQAALHQTTAGSIRCVGGWYDEAAAHAHHLDLQLAHKQWPHAAPSDILA